MDGSATTLGARDVHHDFVTQFDTLERSRMKINWFWLTVLLAVVFAASSDDAERTCLICAGTIESKADSAAPLNVFGKSHKKHAEDYHPHCLIQWVSQGESSCPTCRKGLREKSVFGLRRRPWLPPEAKRAIKERKERLERQRAALKDIEREASNCVVIHCFSRVGLQGAMCYGAVTSQTMQMLIAAVIAEEMEESVVGQARDAICQDAGRFIKFLGNLHVFVAERGMSRPAARQIFLDFVRSPEITVDVCNRLIAMSSGPNL